MTSQPQDRIYLNPPKFWAATKDMTDQDVERLTDKLMRLAAQRSLQELAQYNFISIGYRPAA